jgi:hypothetical protein
MVFYRLLQHAVAAAPVTYKDLVRVGAPKPVKPEPPTSRALPGTLETDDAGRPWRRAAGSGVKPPAAPTITHLRQSHG